MKMLLTRVAVVFMILGTLTADDLLVQTPSGPIQGTTTRSFSDHEVAVFYGIPYALPPVGDRRFSPPVEMESWQKELNATVPSLACYQKTTNNNSDGDIPLLENFEVRPKKPWSENCLKLHIWVPMPRRRSNYRYRVMVYIHGGGFTTGHPLIPMLSGATLADEGNVIVVSMNYRLNVQGFLYLGIPEAPGNMGLMDQQMALKWIQRNIASFGGNPDDVALFGMSAGGASVGFHLLSPGSGDLFSRGILMSGTPNADWAFKSKEDALADSLKLGKRLGCDYQDIKIVYNCIQSTEAELFSDEEGVQSTLGDPAGFVPTVDGTFISDSPMNLLRKGEVKHADVIIGGTTDEGLLFMEQFVPGVLNTPGGRITEKQFQSAINSALKKYDNKTRKLLASIYIDWTRPGDQYMFREAFKALLSDYYFNCPAEEFADLFHSATGNESNVFRYVVDHTFIQLHLQRWLGTPHGFDTPLHLGMAMERRSRFWTIEDFTLSRKVMRWFSNFAHHGSPSGPGESGPVWFISTMPDKLFLRISASSEMQKHYLTQRCAVMKEVLAQSN